MIRESNDGQVGNLNTRATRYVLCTEKTESELFYQCRPLGLPKLADDRTGSVRDVCFEALCQSMPINEQFLCGYRLIVD